MGMIKQFAEEVSEKMGYEGRLTSEVMMVAQTLLDMGVTSLAPVKRIIKYEGNYKFLLDINPMNREERWDD